MRPALFRIALPVLLAIYPALFIAGGNPGEFAGIELLLTCAILAIVGTVVGGAVWLLRRARRTPGSDALIAGAIAWWLGWPLLLAAWLRSMNAGAIGLPRIMLPIATVLVVLILIWVWRGADRRRAAILATTFAAALAFFAFITAIRAWRPVPARVSAASTSAAAGPDIFLIILDAYPSSRVLAAEYGYSNRSFEDSLRALGFQIPKVAFSNYSATALTLASLLNMDHVSSLAPNLARERQPNGVLYRLIEDNAVVRFLVRRGYAFVLFPSTDFPGTQRNRLADERRVAPDAGVLRTALGASLFAQSVWSTTAPGYVAERLGYGVHSPALAVETFRHMPEAAQLQRPVFALGHVMITHEPYFFDASCQRSRAARQAAPFDRDALIAAVECTNSLLLDAVTRIIRSADRPPVILLQADHGTAKSFDPPPRTAAAITGRQARERFGAFGAYLLPGTEVLPDTVTPVNLFPIVLSRLFHVEIPLRPNVAFYSVPDAPFTLHPVTADSLGSSS